MLPNHRLLARAFHRTSQSIAHGPHAIPKRGPSSLTSVSVSETRTNRFSNARPLAKWEGSQPENHSTREESDAHNPQQDGTAEGKKERALGGGDDGSKGRGTSESGGGSVEKAKRESKSDGVEKNAGIGMQDERGGKE